ncbi:heavy metal translocating P-type ATPase [Candidatus Albibeggiatoa sp. nov. NOAA]|uniref:heavy metal translocating P-type ATPase n=1 Tax=Candidatus Albibeggiatoa sp. nov. NOAA TaxID=3162724 RepID=UPI00330355D1|nr:heavy metal translocating P-type ATPase [Thiotrichaceae bacterium]
MIHLAGILLVGAGVAASRVDWKKVAKDTRSYLSVAGDKSAQAYVENDEQEVALKQAEDTGLSVIEEESNRKPYQFAVTSGVMGTAIASQLFFPALAPVSLLLIGYTAAEIFREAGDAIFKEKQVKVDILDATVISLCLVFGQIGAAAFMVWVLDIADLLLEKTRRQSRQYLADIFGEQARFAWLLVDGQEVQTPVEELNKGDIIIVNTGEQVPIDGEIVYGEAMIDQHSLTGESAPVEKHLGDEALATTVLVGGKIHVKVDKTGNDTVASKVLEIINDAATYKVDLQSMGEDIADRMVLPTLGLGALGYAVTSPSAMLAIINADYGTGIRVAAPIALLAALGKSAKNGVLVKDSRVFENLNHIDAVLFDKTGTLTHDVPKVANIVLTDNKYSEDKILLYTATAEQKFSHPIANAILQEAENRGMTLPAHDDSKYHVGFGIEVMVQGDLVKVGSGRYMEREEIELPEVIEAALQDTRDRGHSAILIAINNKIAGLIELQSSVRDEAREIIESLHQRGVKEIILISGDHEAPTRELAGELGVDRYFAGVLPHEKADHVKALQEEGKKVMMVGDGINDSAALSFADIGVSLHGASTIAVDVADVIFMDGHLQKFDYLFEVADTLQENVQRSFYLIAIPNTFCILGGLLGYFGLASSLVLNNGFNLVAAINGSMLYAETDMPQEKDVTAETIEIKEDSSQDVKTEATSENTQQEPEKIAA